jgi:hypothetical protein
MYKLCQPFKNEPAQSVIRIADNACIPFDEQNTDYIAYLAWLAEGNTPLPAENT